jgi:hypothetical protein
MRLLAASRHRADDTGTSPEKQTGAASPNH